MVQQKAMNSGGRGRSPAFLRTLDVLPELTLSRAGDDDRARLERYINASFADRHGASVDHFLPQLLGVGQGGRYCAAVGFGEAGNGPLFAEQYLRAPIEQLISERIGLPVNRQSVVEIGNLVSTWRGGTLLLFVVLSELVDRLGSRYALFTATPEVERGLARLGYAPVVLAAADPSRLADGGASWGRYYERGPRVMYGEAPPAIAAARCKLSYRLLAAALAPQIDRLLAASESDLVAPALVAA